MREFTYRYRKSINPRGELTSESVFDILHLLWEKRRKWQLGETHCPTTAFLHRHCNCWWCWCWCEASCDGHHRSQLQLQLQRTLFSSLSANKKYAVECILKKKKKKLSNCSVRCWARQRGPETLRGFLKKIYVSKFFSFFLFEKKKKNLSLPIDCLMVSNYMK